MEISEKQNEKIKEMAEKYSLRLVLLFGSQVNGQIHKESDYDIAYLSERDLSFEEKIQLNVDFTAIFQNERERVDTIEFKKASPLLFYGIFRQSQILFQKDELTFPRYRAYAFKKYIETKPLYEGKFSRLIERLKR